MRGNHTTGDRFFRKDGQQFGVRVEAAQIDFVRPAVFRESLFDSCVVFHANDHNVEPRGTDFVLENNYFTESQGCSLAGAFRKLLVRNNIFDRNTVLNLWDQKHTALGEVSNNTVLGNVASPSSAPRGTVAFATTRRIRADASAGSDHRW